MNVIRSENATRDGNASVHAQALATTLHGVGERAEENPRLDRDTTRDEVRGEGAEQVGDATRLTSLLHRAGIDTVSGSAASRVTNDGTAKKVATTAEELNLGPASAPRTTLTPRLSEGARSFANNLDRVVTNHLEQLRTNPNVRMLTAGADGRQTGTQRTLNVNHNPLHNVLVPRDTTPAVSDGEMAKRLQLQDLSKLSSDQLLSEFLKLNINDPNANVETQNKLYELASQMRKLAIEEAKKRIERAQELMKEAQKMADRAEKYANMAGMIGIAAAFMGPLGGILSGIMQIVVAVMQYQAQMKMLDAKEEKNNADRFKLMGDMHQNQVEETGDTINKIMELKNQMVDSVISMINASFSTQQQLLSASMAR